MRKVLSEIFRSQPETPEALIGEVESGLTLRTSPGTHFPEAVAAATYLSLMTEKDVAFTFNNGTFTVRFSDVRPPVDAYRQYCES